VIAHDTAANRAYARGREAGTARALADLKNRLAEAAAPDLPPRDPMPLPRRP
jgi:hypothetical protein